VRLLDNFFPQVSYFSTVVPKGKNVSEMATDMCERMFSKPLGKNLNWIGTNNKRGIKEMRCARCLKGDNFAFYFNYSGKYTSVLYIILNEMIQI